MMTQSPSDFLKAILLQVILLIDQTRQSSSAFYPWGRDCSLTQHFSIAVSIQGFFRFIIDWVL